MKLVEVKQNNYIINRTIGNRLMCLIHIFNVIIMKHYKNLRFLFNFFNTYFLVVMTHNLIISKEMKLNSVKLHHFIEKSS